MNAKDEAARKSPLMRFWAVTMTSIYYIGPNDGALGVNVVKTAIHKGTSEIGVGQRLEPWGSAQMVSIGKHVITFIPEGGGLTSFNRRIEGVNSFSVSFSVLSSSLIESFDAARR